MQYSPSYYNYTKETQKGEVCNTLEYKNNNLYKTLIRNLRAKRKSGRRKHRWECSIKISIMKIYD